MGLSPTVFPQAPGLLEGTRTHFLWREGPSEPYTLPHKHARSLTNTLVRQAWATPSQVSAAPPLLHSPLALVRGWQGGGVSMASPVTRGYCRVAKWPARPWQSAQFCRPRPLLGLRWGPHWEQSLQRQAQPRAPVATWRRGHDSAHGPHPPCPTPACLGRALRGRSGSSWPGHGRSLSGRWSLDTCS